MAFLCLYPLFLFTSFASNFDRIRSVSLTVRANKWKKGVLFIASIPILLHGRARKCLIFCIYSLGRSHKVRFLFHLLSVVPYQEGLKLIVFCKMTLTI